MDSPKIRVSDILGDHSDIIADIEEISAITYSISIIIGQ
jgi:hypothetical protein